MADLRYEEWPGEDYPRIVSIKTRGTAGLLRLRECLELLARGERAEVDLLAEMPATSRTVGRCVWHMVLGHVERSVTLEVLSDGRRAVDWYANPSWWQGQLERFAGYLADGPQLVSRPGFGPAACLYPEIESEYDVVFEAKPCVWENLPT